MRESTDLRYISNHDLTNGLLHSIPGPRNLVWFIGIVGLIRNLNLLGLFFDFYIFFLFIRFINQIDYSFRNYLITIYSKNSINY